MMLRRRPVLANDNREHLDLAGEHHHKTLATCGLLHAREHHSLSSARCVGMDMRNGGVDDGGFEGTPDLGGVRGEHGEVLVRQFQGQIRALGVL